MPKDDKYYYSYTTSNFLKQEPLVIIWDPNYIVEVEEDVDRRQHISLNINKLNQKDFTRPKSDTYTKVRSIIKQVFDKHYSLALKYVQQTNLDDGEFYLHKHNKDWYEAKYFSMDAKSKCSIEIDFRDGVDSLWISLICSPRYRGRPAARKEATATSKEQFQQLLNLTLNFLDDTSSYQLLLDDFIYHFYGICKGETKLEGILLSEGKRFDSIIEQLVLRKNYIEKRLIENDDDPPLERARMRGELDGVQYALGYSVLK